MTIVVPADADSAARATRAVAALPGPAYLRLDRTEVPFPDDPSAPVFRLGLARILRAGDDVALIACGPYPVAMAVTAATELAGCGIGARVLDLHTLWPFDDAAVIRAAVETGRIVTVEEHAAAGGLGDAVGEVVAAAAPCWIRRIAARPPIPLRVGAHADLLAAAGIRVSAIVAAARDLCVADRPGSEHHTHADG
jgi:transketolase